MRKLRCKQRNNNDESTLENSKVLFLCRKDGMIMKYIIRDRESGYEITSCTTLECAEKLLEEYEKEDKEDGIYTPDFYEIVEEVKA